MPTATLAGDPCKALTPSQVTNLLGVTAAGKAQDTGYAQMCHWANLDRGSSISVQYLHAWVGGLRAVYAKRNEGFFIELAPVQGYPAAAYGGSDDRPIGRCSVAVGSTDTDIIGDFEADATISRTKVRHADACDSARRIADAVVTTLKAGTR